VSDHFGDMKEDKSSRLAGKLVGGAMAVVLLLALIVWLLPA
jgi:hypothetical protein